MLFEIYLLRTIFPVSSIQRRESRGHEPWREDSQACGGRFPPVRGLALYWLCPRKAARDRQGQTGSSRDQRWNEKRGRAQRGRPSGWGPLASWELQDSGASMRSGLPEQQGPCGITGCPRDRGAGDVCPEWRALLDFTRIRTLAPNTKISNLKKALVTLQLKACLKGSLF